MSKTKLGVAAVVCCTVLVGSGVFAQDQKTERREKLRKLGETSAGIAVDHIGSIGEDGEAEVVAGSVIVLGKPGTKAKVINNGGLIIVRVPDSGSRPPQDIKVEAGRQFQRLGQVRGVTQKNGEPQMGGGYTWILLKPVSDGEGMIVASFTLNGGGAAVKREFKVNVTTTEPH